MYEKKIRTPPPRKISGYAPARFHTLHFLQKLLILLFILYEWLILDFLWYNIILWIWLIWLKILNLWGQWNRLRSEHPLFKSEDYPKKISSFRLHYTSSGTGFENNFFGWWISLKRIIINWELSRNYSKNVQYLGEN